MGITGPGPDGVVLPDDLPPDTYQICPVDGDASSCAQLEATDGP